MDKSQDWLTPGSKFIEWRLIQVETNQNVPVEHQNVPEGHRGLHDFLYSSDDEHAAPEIATPVDLENDGTEVLPLQSWCDRVQNAKIAGVYAVLNTQYQTQYIGYSRNVLLSLNGHVAQNGRETCAFVRVQAFKFPKRTDMENLREAWISELGSVPPGNAEVSEMWASTVGEVAKAAMSPEERNAYEEKKLKLRKAMADSTLTKDLADAEESDAKRQQKLEAAVNNDDWSAVIEGQTRETHS